MLDAGKQLTPRADQDGHRFSPGTGAKRASRIAGNHIIVVVFIQKVVFYPGSASDAGNTRADP
jgi:hypothetical protein